MSSVGIVILAAGASTRMGTPKQLLCYAGKSLLRRAAETALASQGQPVVVVLGAAGEHCRPELEGLPVRIVENPDWEQGMSASLRLVHEDRLLTDGDLNHATISAQFCRCVSAASCRRSGNRIAFPPK